METNCYLDESKDIKDNERMARATREMYQEVQNNQFILNIVKDKLQHGSWTVLGWFNFTDELSLNTYFKMLKHFNLPLEPSVEDKIFNQLIGDNADSYLFTQKADEYKAEYLQRNKTKEKGRNRIVDFLKACI